MTPSTVSRVRAGSRALRGAIDAAVVAALVLTCAAVTAPAAAAAPGGPGASSSPAGPASPSGLPVAVQARAAADCPGTVELQPMTVPTAAVRHRAVGAQLPDDGGATAAPASIGLRRIDVGGDRRHALVLTVGAGRSALVIPVYLAPPGCAISGFREVAATGTPEGRRSVLVPGYGVRLTSQATSSCHCMTYV